MSSISEEDGQQSTKLQTDLVAIETLVHTTAQQYRQRSRELLAILRLLEFLHKEIREELFQDSLPDNRQALYALLRDIELDGGWPYIHRMKLQAFLSQLPPDPDHDCKRSMND